MPSMERMPVTVTVVKVFNPLPERVKLLNVPLLIVCADPSKTTVLVFAVKLPLFVQLPFTVNVPLRVSVAPELMVNIPLTVVPVPKVVVPAEMIKL
ncbi:MAG TPA: hypothetical protein VFG54_04295 [Prolixibacteraceae bacterium]|nr:hypothetical protein [Prolixibacteraceae bacterium]